MKRSTMVAIAVILAAALTALLAGCGGDTGRAKEYMQRGDKLLERLQDEAQQWQAELSGSSRELADQAKSASVVEKSKKSTTRLSETAGEAKVEFKKIKDLGGAGGYSRYADLQIEALDKFQRLIRVTNDYFDQLVGFVNSNNIQGATQALEKYQTEVNRLGEQISKLDEDAQRLKADENL